MSGSLWCEDGPLHAELVASLGTPPLHVAVNVLRAPPRPGVPLVDEPAARLRELTDTRLLRVTRLMRGQVARMGRERGLVVNLLERSAQPDSLALAVDDGIVALSQVLHQQHPRMGFLCIQHGRVPLAPGTLARVITERVRLADVPWGSSPLILDGGQDVF